MTETKNLPTQLNDQSLVTFTGKHHSLVARGMTALSKNEDDAIYRQARETYNKLTHNGAGCWSGYEERRVPLTKALEIFLKLATKGYEKAFFPLSTLYSGDQSIKGDSVQSERYYRLALHWLHANEHLNDVEIWNDLGMLYLGKNNEIAVRYFQKGADAEDPNCMWMLSGAYEFGDGVEQDWSKSLYWQIKAAMEGILDAQLGLECQHKHGDLDIDDEQVFDWYTWSAEQGHLWAQVLLADIYFDDHVIIYPEVYEGIEEFCSRWYNEEQAIYWHDEAQAAYWYEKAAIQGDPHAQLQIGKMYWGGCSVESDDEQAELWLKKAANQEAPEAQFELAKFMAYKLCLLPFDEAMNISDEIDRKCYELIQRAASQNYGPAQYDIVKDISFPVDSDELPILFDKALSWYEGRVEFGDSKLSFELALMHLDNWNASYNILNRAWHPKGLKLLTDIILEPMVVSEDTLKPLPSLVQLLALARLASEISKCPNTKYTAEAKHCWTIVMQQLGKDNGEYDAT